MALMIAVACFLSFLLRFLLGLCGLSSGDARTTLVIALIGTGILYTSLFSAAAWFLPGLRPQDKDQLVRFVPYGKQILAAFRLKEPLAG